MITHEEQLELFNIISKSIKKDVTCYAFGGTAMMFYGYKDETKDIDILFETQKERDQFIETIMKMGFNENNAKKIYIPEKLRDPHRPLMFERGDIRFDLFVKSIFQTTISPKMMEDLFAVHQFKGAKTVTMKVFSSEHIVQLKAVTERDRDMEDIITIIKKNKHFDWNYLIEETIWQHKHGDSWALLDIEKTLKELKQYMFIEKKYFDMLYAVK